MGDPIKTKVTRLKGVGYGIRVWILGKLFKEESVRTRAEVGPALKETLRMADKCGAQSPMARASRDRFFCRSGGHNEDDE